MGVALRQLGTANTDSAKSIEKLSSGYRINRAGDDAAGLAISEKMRGQIRGLNQASANAQDGISMIQTAEGALNETHAILQRMRELAVQGSTDTNTASDRGEIQKEISQLSEEIDRISTTTEFNTQKLLNGSLGAQGQSADTTVADVTSATGLKLGEYTVAVTTGATQATSTGSITAGLDALAALATDKALTLNGISIDTSGVTDVASLKVAINAASDKTGVTMTDGADAAAIELTSTEYGSAAAITIGGDTEFTADIFGTEVDVAGKDAVVTVTNADQSAQTITGTGQKVIYGSAELKVTGADASSTTFDVTSAGATIHIGANSGQAMLVDVNEISTNTLGNATNKIKDVSVLTQGGADTAITTINDALELVSSERSKLGSFQNRLEHTIKNLDTSSENLQASESRIRDVDMAKEMMEQTKQNILAQASTAMLAQANQAPQAVLQLLR